MRLRWIPDWFARSEYCWIEIPRDRSLRSALPEIDSKDRLFVWRNGVRVPNEDLAGDDWIICADERDVLEATCSPAGIDPVSIAITLAISFAVSYVVGRLLAPSRRSTDMDDGGNTYGWDGLRSSRTEGSPIQLVYGRIRTAGSIVNEGIENLQTPDGPSRYFAQVAIGSGPIHSVGGTFLDTPDERDLSSDLPGRDVPFGIFFDKNPAESMRGVSAAVRLGSVDQRRCTGFDFIESPTDLSVELRAPEVSASNPSAPLIHPTTTAQAAQDTYWDNYGRSFDLPDESDACRITVRFSRGWIVAPNTARWFSLAVRYIELDGNGRPINDGGDFGDGYVRLPYWLSFFRNPGPFSADFQFHLFDPRTYVVATGGSSLEGDGTSDAGAPTTSICVVTTPTVPWTDGVNISALSISAWIRVDELTLGSIEDAFLIAQQKTGATAGFGVRLRKKSFFVSPSVTLTEWLPVLEMPGSTLAGDQFFEGHNDSTRRPRFFIRDPDDHDEQRHHVVFTYASRTVLGGPDDRLRVYANGMLLYETLGNVQLKGSTGSFYAGRDPAVLRPMDGTIDELWVLHTEMSVHQVYRAYNNGAGVIGAVGTSGAPGVFPAAQVVFGYHFDEFIATGTAQSFGTTYNNHADVSGTRINIQGRQVVIRHSSSSVARRARYRIEVARNIAESTDSSNIDDGLELVRVTGIVDEQREMPGTAYVSLRVAASEELNSKVPDVAMDVRGRLCPVWTGSDPLNPSFSMQWTRSPAWVCTDLILDKLVGMGNRHDPSQIDVVSLAELDDYASEAIYDLAGNRMTGNQAATSTPVRVTRMRYDSSVSGRPEFGLNGGRIQMFFNGAPPPNIRVGEFIAWTGEATSSGFVDHNFGANETGGYEIVTMFKSGTSAWSAELYWGRATEGTPWTDGEWLDQSPGLAFQPYVGLYEGRTRRHSYDAVHDIAEGAWGVLGEVAAVGRAAIVYDGKKVRFKINRTREPIGVVSNASIIPDSFEVEYGGPADRPNAYIVEFLDEDNGWERSAVYVRHESVTDVTSLDGLREETIFVRGITRRHAALRHGKFLVNLNQLIFRTGSFRVAVDAVHWEVGDVVVVQHDMLPWGIGGRSAGGATSASEIALDRQIEVHATDETMIDVSHPAQNRRMTRAIVSPPGVYQAGDVLDLDSPLDFVAGAALRYVVYTLADRVLVEITFMRLATDKSVEVEWAEYVDAVYDDEPTPLSSGGTGIAALGTENLLDSIGTESLDDEIGTEG